MKLAQKTKAIHEKTIAILIFMHSKKDKVILYSTLIYLVLCAIYLFANTWITTMFMGFVVMIYFLLFFCVSMPKILVSLHRLITTGIIYSLVISIAIYIVFCINTQSHSFMLRYYIFFAINTMVWNIFSLAANCKVATLTNAILTAVLGLIQIGLESIIEIISKVEPYDAFVINGNVELALKIILTPLIVTNIIATVVCATKMYWIEKYADGFDLTEDLLQQKMCQ